VEKRLQRLPDRVYFLGLLPALSLLPRKIACRLIRRQGRQIQSFLRKHDQSIQSNLASSGFEAPEAIARAFFEVLASEDLDAYYFKHWNRANIDRYFDFEGLGILEEAIAGGRGAILLTGHVGCVCSALVAMGIKGFPVTHVARGYPWEQSLPPAFLNYALKKVSWMEEKMRNQLIYAPAAADPQRSASASLEVLTSVRANKLVSMAIDVVPDMAPQRETAKFLGRICSFPTNFLRIAYASGAPIIPYYTIRDTSNWVRQRLTVEPPVALKGHLRDDLQVCVSQFERVVRKFPEQWFSWDSLSVFLSQDRTRG